MKSLRRWVTWLVILIGLPAAGVWLWRARQVQAKADLPVASARKGEFEVIVRCRGELVSGRSVQLVAPTNVPGMQIAWQAPPNGEVKEGDVVIRFDSSLAKQQLLEKQAALQQAQATLDQAVAQARITSEQDRLDLASAHVDLEKAKLEVTKQELVSPLQGEESKIDMGLSAEKLHVQEATNDLHKTSDAQKIGSATRLRDKAQQDIDVTNERLSHMEMHAPSNGVVVYVNNYSQGWINAKPFKVGDSVFPNTVVAEIPDLSTLEMKAKLEEIDRGRIVAEQDARILVDSFPEKPFAGKVSSISPLVEQGFDWPPTRNFRAFVRFVDRDSKLPPAMNSRVDIIVERIPNAISVPATAVFTRQGRPTVYVAEKNAWLPHEVEILARNPDEVAIKGIAEGTKVSLVEPDAAGAEREPEAEVKIKKIIGPGIAAASIALAAWGGVRLYRVSTATTDTVVPTTSVKRGDVTFAVYARGEFQGGNSIMLTAPMAGGSDMTIMSLRAPGELVKANDIVAEFDTTEQIYKLKEAEADLAEAEQKVIQAQAQMEAKEEEDNYLLIKAKSDLKQAELDARKNPVLSAIQAKQNDLAVEGAKATLDQLTRDLANRKATSQAGVEIQRAVVAKAKVQIDTAKKNIEMMTLRAPRDGYVNVQSNTNTNMFYSGMILPMLQVGDTVRAGMAVAQLPDMKNWEATVHIAEADRGHLALHQPAVVTAVALPEHPYHGKISDLGGTAGPMWDRRFECKISIEDASPELRAGMTANIVITAETLKKVLWIPAQALFESDGRTFVYGRTPEGGFATADVKLVRRSESQVVITGANEGQEVALARPDQKKEEKKAGSATQAVTK